MNLQCVETISNEWYYKKFLYTHTHSRKLTNIKITEKYSKFSIPHVKKLPKFFFSLFELSQWPRVRVGFVLIIFLHAKEKTVKMS